MTRGYPHAPVDLFPPVRCSAKNHATGEQCKSWAMHGAVHCFYHCGGRERRAAQRRVREAIVENKARRAVARRVVREIDDPLRELQKVAAEAVAFKDVLATYVKRLRGAIRYKDARGAEQLRAEVVVYERALDRTVEALGKIARLKIDERLAAIDAAKKLMVIRALEAALTSAGVSGPALVEAKKVAGRHLRMISSGEPIEGEIVADGEHTAA